mmetsp:Transcript_21766/g.31826  ORF Transcript_21766/g.31826 Transcript_21766/m.31826 type:complete len:83 (+) Transcript_21766:53-301(+)
MKYKVHNTKVEILLTVKVEISNEHCVGFNLTRQERSFTAHVGGLEIFPNCFENWYIQALLSRNQKMGKKVILTRICEFASSF